jgi:uncharacterized membrane protein
MATITSPAMKQLRELIGEPPEGSRMRNVNQLHDDSMTLGMRVADAVARNMGSWRFITIQSTILFLWILANAALLVHDVSVAGLNLSRWDPYPFILLNLALSFQAAYAAPFIMMSQNRQADKDRLAAEHDYHVNIRAEATVRAILEHLKCQDDVILTILRNMQHAAGDQPNEEQRRAEERLRRVRETESEIVTRTIQEEEAEAGLPVR